MVPAYAASLAQSEGFTVYWMDGIAEKKTKIEWFEELKKNNPDFLLLETKSPIIKIHWKLISEIKNKFPQIKIILVGDHVTFIPLESFSSCPVDYIIAGGDYDFVVVNLLKHIQNKVLLEGGVYWRKGDSLVKAEPKITQETEKKETIYSSGPFALRHRLDDLPFIDRDLTKWELYAYENGNYKYTPATYMYSGRDCWWNQCTFCVWDHTLNPLGTYRSFSPERLFAEVKYVVDRYHVKEIFDDAGTLFVGQKLKRFCDLMIESGYNKKLVYGCNMRFNALSRKEYDLMKQANFRFILYGMESGNQVTLDRIKKGIKVSDIYRGAKDAHDAGLEPHATIMLGYPWESYEDAEKTISVAKDCFKKGYFHTMQATIVIPYPGTPLWKECKEHGWLLTEDYDEYDMRKPVMKIPFDTKKLLSLEQDLYTAFMSPQFIIRKILSVRSLHDFLYFFYMAKKLLAHLLDFDPNQKQTNFFSLQFWKQATSKLFHQLFRS